MSLAAPRFGVDATQQRRRFDRRLYLAAGIAFLLIVVTGFARTYYAGRVFGAPPLPSPLVHVHGALMTAWVLLFIVQVRLIASARIRLHQRLGYAAIGLAVLIIATGIPVAARAGKYGSPSFPADVPSLAFMAIPMTDLVMFALLFGGAIYYRRRPAAHKTLMLLTAISFLPRPSPASRWRPFRRSGRCCFSAFPSSSLSCAWRSTRGGTGG